MRLQSGTSRYLLPGLTVGLLIASALALSWGALSIPYSTLLNAVGLPIGQPAQPFEITTLWHLRLPRLLLAIGVGAALAVAGTAMQGLVRNPLADPGLIGLSSGAALAASAVMVLGLALDLNPASTSRWVLPLAAFAGAGMSALLVLSLAQYEGYTRVSTLLLAGLAINAVAGAGIGFLANVADDRALRSVTFWMFGSLARAGWSEIAIALPLLMIPILALPREAAALNALLLGEAEAGHLGVDVERLKRRVMLLVILAVGVSVAVAGIIGFVGLIVPHLLRLQMGPDHRKLLPAAALGGALLLTLGDTLSRSLLAPAELPIGILTALIGGPVFLLLLLRYRQSPELA